jgi:hypothetical protein
MSITQLNKQKTEKLGKTEKLEKNVKKSDMPLFFGDFVRTEVDLLRAKLRLLRFSVDNSDCDRFLILKESSIPIVPIHRLLDSFKSSNSIWIDCTTPHTVIYHAIHFFDFFFLTIFVNLFFLLLSIFFRMKRWINY